MQKQFLHRVLTVNCPLSTVNFPNNAAADHDVPVIQDHCLTDSQRPDRLVELICTRPSGRTVAVQSVSRA